MIAIKDNKKLYTMILAYDMEDKARPQDIFVFFAMHHPVLNLGTAVRCAFSNWATTEAGKFYIDVHGCNWGDALEIPNGYLKLFGILKLWAPSNHEQLKLPYNKLIVDHNERLVPR